MQNAAVGTKQKARAAAEHQDIAGTHKNAAQAIKRPNKPSTKRKPTPALVETAWETGKERSGV
jgi:hypothetical protein